MSHSAAIESEMHSLTARLRKARQGLSKGTIIDLTPIEQDVKGLCQAIEALPREESRHLRPRLFGLVEEVNQLGENLRAGLGELAEMLNAASDRRKALTAYAAPKSDKP